MFRAEHSLPGGVSAGSSVTPSIALQIHFFFSLGLTFHSRQDKPKRAQRRKAQILSRPTEWVLGGKTTKLGWVLLRAQKQSQEDGVRRAGTHFLLHLQQQRHFVLNVIKLWMGLSFLRSLLPEVTRSPSPTVSWDAGRKVPSHKHAEDTTQRCPHPWPPPSSPKAPQGHFPSYSLTMIWDSFIFSSAGENTTSADSLDEFVWINHTSLAILLALFFLFLGAYHSPVCKIYHRVGIWQTLGSWPKTVD